MDIHKFVDAVLLMKTRYGVVGIGVSADTYDRILVHMEEHDRNAGVRPQIPVGDLLLHGIPIKRAAPFRLSPPTKPRTLAEDLPGSY
jgi:hypothetical protein